MLRRSTPTRRVAGRLLIAVAVLVALPLTAGRAVAYVDVPQPEAPVIPAIHAIHAIQAVHSSPAVAAAAEIQAVPAAPVAQAAHDRPAQHADLDGNLTINDDMVTIDGKTKRWEDLTPAEKAKVAAAVAKARSSLANAHLDQAKMMRDLSNIPDKARMEQLQRDLEGTQSKLAKSIGRIDEEAAKARSAGRTPDALDAAIREKLQSVQTIDLSEATRALANIDRDEIAAEVAGAGQAMEKAKAELERMQARIDADQRH